MGANALAGPATSTRHRIKSKKGKLGKRPATFPRSRRTLPVIPFKGGRGGGGGGGGDIAKNGRALAVKATSATQKSTRSAAPLRRRSGGQTSQRVEPGSTRETFLSEMYTKIATARDKKSSSRSSRGLTRRI